MTRPPSPLSLPARAMRWRALVSWMCCTAALVLAVTVCHQTGPTSTAPTTRVPAASVPAESQMPVGGTQGCVNHQPGDTCLTGLQHLPQSLQPLPDTPALSAHAPARTPAPAPTGPAEPATAPRHAVDLHSLQVLRI
ncbi:hypothetical protein [Streptomyces roseolus]|uniref:hypothetical protein n=1 Tax=Streptomyces roseolus TaxID=67358 RepID=UPI00378D4DC7